jgi:hypothetical protein
VHTERTRLRTQISALSTLCLGRVGIQFHIPIEIVTPAVRCISNPDGNSDNGIPTRLHRLLRELHAGFLRCPTAFLVVATPAGCHDILPGLSPTLGDGDDVIERQFLGPELVTTILAGIAISREDINAREFDRPMDILEADQFEEPHDGGKPDGDRNSVNLSVVDLKDFNFALPKERDRFLPIDNPQGFVRRVEEKGHLHAAASFPTKAPCVRGPGCSIGTRTYVYAISLGRNQVTDESTYCVCAIGRSA